MSLVIGYVLPALLLLALVAGAPLFTILGGAAIACFALVAHESIAAVIVEMTRLANAPGITAVPMFIFAGYVLAESKCSSRIIRVSNAAIGWIPGGLVLVKGKGMLR